MIKAEFDALGLPLSFYDASLHGATIPVTAIEITEQQWQVFLSNPGQRRWVDGAVAPVIQTTSNAKETP